MYTTSLSFPEHHTGVVICMYEQALEHLSINTSHSSVGPSCVEMVHIFLGERTALRRGHRSMYVCIFTFVCIFANTFQHAPSSHRPEI